MADDFRTKQQRFNEALDQVDSTLSETLALLDDLPSFVVNSGQARQVLDSYHATRDTLRTYQRRLEKI